VTRILVIDNYDSFVFNIVQYLAQLGAKVDVKRNDEVSVEQAREYDGILLSPGPGTPADAGICSDLVRELGGIIPIFGVCLGHQVIAEVFGATVSQAPELLHGKTSQVFHHNQGVLANLPSPFIATRYHSLAVERDSVPQVLEITSETDTGVVMSLLHRELDIEGVQFHPESVLTQGGHKMLAEWLVRCGDLNARELAEGLQPVIPN
jgi:para-aminobenzoate synthetase component 2